jgi:hypothetical protein
MNPCPSARPGKGSENRIGWGTSRSGSDQRERRSEDADFVRLWVPGGALVPKNEQNDMLRKRHRTSARGMEAGRSRPGIPFRDLRGSGHDSLVRQSRTRQKAILPYLLFLFTLALIGCGDKLSRLPADVPNQGRSMTGEEAYEARSRIFGGLPPDIFRIFSGEARWFYADLLEHIDRDVFGDIPGVVSRQEMTQAIREFIDRQGRNIQLDDEASHAPAADTADAKAIVAYRRFIDTGWLPNFGTATAASSI